MTAQSTLKTCSSCESAFRSYIQHLPVVIKAQEKVPFRTLTNLALNSRGFERDQQSSEICVASKMSLDDSSISTFVSCSLDPRIEMRTPSSLGVVIASVPTRRPPISGLPTELMILVLQYACDDIEYWLTALTLSLVSREWRSIAHALPELWTHISLDVKHAGPLEIVWWYLHLSRDAPLDVKMDILGDGEFEQAAGLLVKNATRWRWADIRCASEDLPIFKGIKKTGVPMLESLKFDVAGSGWDMKRCKAFRDAPRLRVYAPAGVSPSECAVAWDQLKAVVIRDFFDADLYEYLRDAEAMEELVMDEECFFGTAFGAGMSTPLSASRLTMRSVPRLVDSTFMGAFVLPSLTVVDISLADGITVDARFLPSFVGLLKRSGCSLGELTLHNVPLDDEAMLDIVACAPQLRALAIHEPAKEHCITNAFLSTVLLPELRQLELVWSYDACEERILDMVERMKGLEYVVLGRRFGLELSEGCVERMNVLRAGGVRVSQW